MTGDGPTHMLARLLFEKPIERLDGDERADLERLLALDASDDARYERLAAEYPEDDVDATRD